jgi:hypothetical protein
MSRLPRIWYSTSIGLLILALASSAAAGPQREGHAEEAVRYRMSEGALGRLTQIAELRTGVTVLSYEKDNMTGKYFPSYSSSVCPIRGATRLQALFAAGKRDIEPELLRLRTVADADNSGFVSSDEASLFGEMVEFGLRLNYFAKNEENSADRLAGVMCMGAEELRSRVRKYADFVAAAKQQAVVFVPAPVLN